MTAQAERSSVSWLEIERRTHYDLGDKQNLLSRRVIFDALAQRTTRVVKMVLRDIIEAFFSFADSINSNGVSLEKPRCVLKLALLVDSLSRHLEVIRGDGELSL